MLLGSCGPKLLSFNFYMNVVEKRLGPTYSVCCGVNPTFYHKFFIPDHPLHQSGIFLIV